ncbi:unnamed protein product [Musa hybrid cultivar]
MGSEAVVVVVGELPLLPPIKTAPTRDKPVEGRPDAAETEEEECVTPKGGRDRSQARPCLYAGEEKAEAGEEGTAGSFHGIPRRYSRSYLGLPSSPSQEENSCSLI